MSLEKTTGEYVGITLKYFIDGDIFTPMSKYASDALDDFQKRIGVKGQFLNWVESLPKEQLTRLDYIYEIVEELKKTNGNNTLSVIGIGGSKHPVENALNLAGLGEGNIKFYSDIDPLSLNKFKAGLPNSKFTNSDYIVVSKSGRTFESEDGMVQIEKGLIAEYKAEGKSEEEAKKLANKHFIAVTDAGESSKLRKTAEENGYLGKFYVHDDVGGRYSSLDDHTLFALAYAGMPKSDIKEMLEGAIEMTELSLNKDVSKNPAMQKAIFYADAVKNGINDHIHALFGRFFECGTENWLKQFHGESLKDTRYVPMECPAGMHYNAESIFDKRNKYSIHATAFDTEGVAGFENYTTYAQKIVVPNFAKIAPTSLELIKIDAKGVAPRTLGAYIQLKNLETVYKDLVRSFLQSTPLPAVYDAVTQPSVEAYKKSAFSGEHVLVPGK
jgi:hypothetical protein